MRLVSSLLLCATLSVATSARENDIEADLASAGYWPNVASIPTSSSTSIARPNGGRTASFETTLQTSFDLASAGYGPAGVNSARPSDRAASTGLLRSVPDYRASDAIRADLSSAGYLPLPVPRNVLIASPEKRTKESHRPR